LIVNLDVKIIINVINNLWWNFSWWIFIVEFGVKLFFVKFDAIIVIIINWITIFIKSWFSSIWLVSIFIFVIFLEFLDGFFKKLRSLFLSF